MIPKEKLNTLYRYALSLTHHDDRAYDLVHEAIIKSQGRIIFNKQAYLKKTIRHLFYDQYKKDNQEPELVSELEAPGFSEIIINQDELNHNECSIFLFLRRRSHNHCIYKV